MGNVRTVKLGEVGVDSGQIILVDPCYVDKGFDYDEVCTSHTVESTKADHGDMFGGLPFHNGIGGLIRGIPGGAVVTSTGFGDGVYPVYAEVENFGTWGDRVTKVYINFNEDGDEEDNFGSLMGDEEE